MHIPSRAPNCRVTKPAGAARKASTSCFVRARWWNALCMSIETRGPLSETALSLLRGHPAPQPGVVSVSDPLADDDLHLALSLCYEIHYRSLEGIDDRAEWSAEMLGFREALEMPFELALRGSFGLVPTCEPIDIQLMALVEDHDAFLASYMARAGTEQMYRELLVHRSLNNVRQADSYFFAIPHLRGRTKSALVEMAADEAGAHTVPLPDLIRPLGLDQSESGYVDQIPGCTLAMINLISLFALHRRLRGALVGHSAAFRMSSCATDRHYADGLQRLGLGEIATRYFDKHTEAEDAQSVLAARELSAGLLDLEPAMDSEVMFGAASFLGMEGRWAMYMRGCWDRGQSTLASPRESEN